MEPANTSVEIMKPTLTIITVLLIQGVAFAQRQLKTVDGPETPKLAQSLTGYLVTVKPVGGIIAFEFPGGAETTVRRSGKGIGTTHSVSGPDQLGRIAFINGVEKKHLLKTVTIDGTHETEVFTRKGDALWDKVVGEHLSLAPVGGRVAFVSTLRGEQMNDPKAYLSIGNLEVWDIDTKAQVQITPDALDQGLAWFPDGKRVALVKLFPREEVKAQFGGPDDFAAGFGKWDPVPVVCIHDVDTNETTVLHLGWRPVVAEDGETVLVRDWHGRCRRVSVTDRTARLVSWPGNWQGPIALLKNDRVVYSGLQTTGNPAKFTKNNSPLVGPKPEGSIKIADLNGQQFCTLIPYIDPRQDISFGSVTRGSYSKPALEPEHQNGR